MHARPSIPVALLLGAALLLSACSSSANPAASGTGSTAGSAAATSTTLSGGQVAGVQASPSAGGSPVIVPLSEQNGSGLNGIAMLTAEAGGRTRVEIQLNGSDTGDRPAHIHDGT